MPVSSGTVSLFSAVAITIVAAGAGAYGLKHRNEVKDFARHIAASHDAAPGEASGDASVTSDSSETADASENSPASQDAGDVTLRAGDLGHFETEAEINGRSVDVMVDTGATQVAMTYEDAERSGIYLKPADYTQSVSTANGVAKVAPVQIGSVSIGGITVRNVQGNVSEPGKLHRTLLGMSFLGRLSRVEMRSKTLVLHE